MPGWFRSGSLGIGGNRGYLVGSRGRGSGGRAFNQMSGGDFPDARPISPIHGSLSPPSRAQRHWEPFINFNTSYPYGPFHGLFERCFGWGHFSSISSPSFTCFNERWLLPESGCIHQGNTKTQGAQQGDVHCTQLHNRAPISAYTENNK